MNRRPLLRITLILAVVVPAYAHLDRTSLSVKGGESFTAGEQTTITWKMAHWHALSHYIYFRSDTTGTWTLIDSVKGQQSVLNFTYTWTVPVAVSNQAQFMVFLPEFSKTPSTKTDDFTLISKPFSIVSAKTGVAHSQPSGHSQSTGRIQQVSCDLTGRVHDSHARSGFSGLLIVNQYQSSERISSKKQIHRIIHTY